MGPGALGVPSVFGGGTVWTSGVWGPAWARPHGVGSGRASGVQSVLLGPWGSHTRTGRVGGWPGGSGGGVGWGKVK